MNHWALEYIGIPWKFGAAGPECFDCWNFICFIQKKHFNIDTVELAYSDDIRLNSRLLRESNEHENWIKVTEPIEGDLIIMARNKEPMHIGIMIKANGYLGVLHCLNHSGVIFQKLQNLPSSGWGSMQFFRHKTKCPN